MTATPFSSAPVKTSFYSLAIVASRSTGGVSNVVTRQ
jgi:hypothetical protein